MSKIKHLSSAVWIAILSGLLVVAIISTIILASFGFTRQSYVTLRFADNVVLDVSGINDAHVWLASSATDSSIVNDATLSAPAYQSIGVKVTSGPSTDVDVYVRVFAIVYTDYKSIQPITSAAGTTVNSADYTAQERGLVSSVPAGCQYSVICTIVKYSAVSTDFGAVLNQYYPFTNTIDNTHLGKKTQGIVVVTAKNNNTTDPAITTAEWNSILPDATYPKWASI